MNALSWFALVIFAVIFLGGYFALRWTHQYTPKRLASLYVAAALFPIVMLFVTMAGDPLFTLTAAFTALLLLLPVAIILRAPALR